MAEVVGINGCVSIAAGIPRDDLVEELERLIEAARSGEIQGIAGAILYRDGATSVVAAGLCNSRGVIGGLEVVKFRLIAQKELT